MIKISLIFLISFSLCLADPKLRSQTLFRPALWFDLLSEGIRPLNLLPNFILTASESDYLNELAQTLAETEQNPIYFINNYAKSKYSKNVLTFGFKLRGDTKIETILMGDSTEVVDRMSGFLDFRSNGTVMSMEAKEIRNSIQVSRCFTPQNYSPKNCSWAKSSGFMTVNTDNFVKSVNIRSMRDIGPIISLYDQYLESQIKLMDKDGNLPLGYYPLSIRMEMKNFKLNIDSTNTRLYPLRVDPNTSHDDLYELIDTHFRSVIEQFTLEETLQLSKSINAYGFGVALDKDGNINVIYSLGQQGDFQPRTRLTDKLRNFEYVNAQGKKVDAKTFDFEKDSFVDRQMRNNRLMMDAENFYRLNENLRPIRQTDPKLFELALNEAERMAAAGKLSAPTFKTQTKDTILLAFYTVGRTTTKEFVFDITDNEIGSVACFDNFSNSRPKIYKLFESTGAICSKDAVTSWSSFDALGSGIASNANGDVVQVLVLTKSDSIQYCTSKDC